MNFQQYQIEALRTAGQHDDPKLALAIWGLGLTGESGEVVEIIKKYLGHSQPIDRDKITKELGDVLWYLAAVCDALGISLETVAQANIQKLSDRHPGGFSTEYHEHETRNFCRNKA
jgi:NTP pyrophosphatase (non-canonical NTP hydrolase)